MRINKNQGARKRKAGARKAWLGGRLRLKGALVVDGGAAGAHGAALCYRIDYS